jgi:hypothetical protein
MCTLDELFTFTPLEPNLDTGHSDKVPQYKISRQTCVSFQIKIGNESKNIFHRLVPAFRNSEQNACLH